MYDEIGEDNTETIIEDKTKSGSQAMSGDEQ